MNDINRRLFLVMLLLIALVGITILFYYSFSNFTRGETGKKPAATIVRPKYAASIQEGDNRQIKAPLNLCAADGQVYVTDSGANKISVFSQTGAFKYSVTLASGDQFPSPLSVAIDQKRRIYVAATAGSENKIMVFDTKGRFLYTFPEVPNGAEAAISPGKPLALFCANDRLYVTDVIDHDVKVYNLDGGLVARFGRPGTAKGEFLYPNGITADTAGYIYVSDSNNGRVQVFDSKGEFSHLFVPPKKNPLALPRGIAIDKAGQVHVVDTFKHKVFVFTKDGGFLFTYGKFGAGGNGFSYPNGITADSKTGRIFIADKMNNRIAVWK